MLRDWKIKCCWWYCFKFQMQLYLNVLTSDRVSRRTTSMFFSWNHQRTAFWLSSFLCNYYYYYYYLHSCSAQEPELGRYSIRVLLYYSCIRTIQCEMFPAQRNVTLQILFHWVQEQDMQEFFVVATCPHLKTFQIWMFSKRYAWCPGSFLWLSIFGWLQQNGSHQH